jgi:hypothetical protein
MRACEEVIFPIQRHRSNGVLDPVVVDLVATVVQVADQSRPQVKGVSDSLSNGALGKGLDDVFFQPGMKLLACLRSAR